MLYKKGGGAGGRKAPPADKAQGHTAGGLGTQLLVSLDRNQT